jgi:hypothetical protein
MRVVSVIRKPFEGSATQNIVINECGGLNIDATRIGGEPSPSVDRRKYSPKECVGATGWTTPARPASYNEQRAGEQSGRWPANLMLVHTPLCVFEGHVKQKGYMINRWTDGAKPFGGGAGHDYAGQQQNDLNVESWKCHPTCPVSHMDSQSGVSKSSGGRIGNAQGVYSNQGRTGWGTGHQAGDPGYGDSGGASRYFKQVRSK